MSDSRESAHGEHLSFFPGDWVPIYRVMRVPLSSRTDAVTGAIFAALSIAAFPPLPSRASEIEAVLPLTNLLLLRSGLAEVDTTLFASVASRAGVATSEGRGARTRVRNLLKEYRPRDQGRQAAVAATRARLLGSREANEAEEHAKEVEERLVMVLEADAMNALKTDGLNNARPAMAPEEAQFFHRALVTAQDEIIATCACFGEDERRDAQRLAARTLASTSQVPGGELPDLALPGTPGFASQRQREESVSKSIAALGSSRGSELTRGDLQQALDDAWREARRTAPITESRAR